MRSESNPINFPHAIAAPNGPVVPGAWKPRLSLLCFVARPMRIITSAPATMAVINARPPMPRSWATARPDVNSVAPGCTPVLGHVKLSISKACASAPLANAAAGACTRGAPGPRIRLLPPAPFFAANATTMRLQGRS